MHVPPLDFRAGPARRGAKESYARQGPRPRHRAAAVRGYGEYVDGSAGGFASKEARGKDARGGKGARRGFTTGHDEPARGSDLEGRVGGGVGVGTDGSRFLRAGGGGDGCAPSEHSSDVSSDDVSSDDVSDGIGAGDAEVWSAPPERLREALTDPGGGSGARGELRGAARGGGGGTGAGRRGGARFPGRRGGGGSAQAADGKENVEDGGGGGGDGGGGRGAKSAAAKGRAPTGSFFRREAGTEGARRVAAVQHRGSHRDARADVIE